MGASLILLIPNKKGDIGVKDYRSISLIGSIYKILVKVLVGSLQKVFSCVISNKQGAFVTRRHNLDGVIIANECVLSGNRNRLLGYDTRIWHFIHGTHADTVRYGYGYGIRHDTDGIRCINLGYSFPEFMGKKVELVETTDFVPNLLIAFI